MASTERVKIWRRENVHARTVLNMYLAGEEDISFRVAFLSFSVLTHPLTSDQRPPKSLTSIATSTNDLPQDIPIPNSVLVLCRKKNVSNYRRRATRVILGKFLNVIECETMEESEVFWEFRHSEEDQAFLKMVETLEQEIFQCSDELSDYENLLLNFVAYMSSQKCMEELKSSVSNTLSQTEDSFLSGRHKSVEELLLNRQEDFTEEEWSVLVEQNQLVESRARSRRSQGLRHSFTQTLASLHSGLKCIESDSSPEFDWLELAPDPIRFFPVFPAGTQTTEGKGQERQLVWSELVQRLPVDSPKQHDSFFEFLLPKMGPEEEPWDRMVARLFPKGLGVDLKDVSVGVQMGRFLRIMDNFVPTFCFTHKGPKPKPGCPACKAALWMPPPWAHPLFAMMYEVYCGKQWDCLMDNERINGYVTMHLQKARVYQSPIKRLFLSEYVVIHLTRKFLFYNTLLQKQSSGDKREQAKERKKLKETTRNCACLPPEPKGIPGQCSYLVLVDGDHESKGHYCLFCGVRERDLGIKFQVCSECRRQRLFIKAFYCSTDCLVKDRHEHKKIHDAFAPGKIDHQNQTAGIMFPHKKN